ncbi:MAG: flavodoxin family protein [Christensenellales bacterium]
MKVVAFNGSPHEKGNTYAAIRMVGEELEREDVELEVVQVGKHAIRGCLACNVCFKKRDGCCVIQDDPVNGWIRKLEEADGVILGSPVYYAALSGTMKCFLDRAFYVATANGGLFRHKVGASVVAVRRCGGIPAMDQLNHYIGYAEMLMPTSNYWNVIYGNSPNEVVEDEEGKQIMRILGKNMAWLMKLVEYGKGKVEEPEKERKRAMSFIRP